ncbi:carbohydrate ABC transporter permease [Paenibacillus sp. HB172176]|uniref:carbohydrate ABC transporter permease n=1 Tax=Paenibacillus sp. HB172176 TaxID=2493690 RepID=UPI00143B3395|nr:carbohydrate ABC transporter permease [Paenibacillus sp. HB172176]
MSSRYDSFSYKVFTLLNYALLGALAIICVLPLLHILAVSFSDKAPADARLVGLWPVDFTTDAYEKTFGNQNFIRSFFTSITRTALGTITTMALITMAAYALSKEKHEFKGRNVYAWLFVFTMLFHGGLIPSYIIVQKTGLMNSVWALIIPGAVKIFNMILLLNFFRTSVPKALEEAAYIDGAGHLRTLFSVYIPLAVPSIATVSLFNIVGHWNEWFHGLIYMTKPENYPLSTLLQTIVVQADLSQMSLDASDLEELSNRTVKASQIFIATLPILAIYPLLQRYFVKGIVLGSVKQ